MNKLISKVKFATVLFLLTQNVSAQGVVEQLIDPAKSRGYIAWNPIKNAEYKVEIFEKTDSVTYNKISKTGTNGSFHQLDNMLFFTPNMYYKITAHHEVTNDLIAVSDYIPCTPVTDPVVDEAINNNFTTLEMCKKKCNGTSYAWELVLLEKHQVVNFDTIPMGEERIQARSTYVSYDQGLNFVPYWQPISYVALDNLPDNPPHPYKQSTYSLQNGFVYSYQRSPLLSGTSNQYTQLDASGTAVLPGAGILIEKKMDAFGVFSGNTSDLINGDNLCPAPLNGGGSWIDIYNNNYDQALFNSAAQAYNWPSIMPTGLECIAAPTNSGTGGTSGSGGGPGPRKHYQHFLAQVNVLDSISSWGTDGWSWGRLTLPDSWRELSTYFSSLIDVVSEDGDSLIGITIDAVLDSTIRIDFEKNKVGELELLTSKGRLTPGVYRVLLHISNGHVFPIFYEFNSELPEAKKKDFVKMSVSPNPVSDDNLKVTIYASQQMSGQLMVFDLYGNILYNESVNIAAKDEITKTYLVDGVYPYNQLRVSLILQDGSVVQQSVLVQ